MPNTIPKIQKQIRWDFYSQGTDCICETEVNKTDLKMEFLKSILKVSNLQNTVYFKGKYKLSFSAYHLLFFNSSKLTTKVCMIKRKSRRSKRVC